MAPTRKEFGGKYLRLTEASGANTALSVLTPADVPYRLCWVLVKYSAAPTQAGVTVELDAGAGAAFDGVLTTGSANAQTTVYLPDPKIVIAENDIIKVTAPAGGAGITSQISIYVELL
jgi:hypothetical protein